MFSYGALDRLEAAGVQIVTSLEKILKQLADAIGLPNSNYYKYVETAISKWMEGYSHRPVTWRSLLDVLKELNQEELVQQIEGYFRCEFCILFTSYKYGFNLFQIHLL